MFTFQHLVQQHITSESMKHNLPLAFNSSMTCYNHSIEKGGIKEK